VGDVLDGEGPVGVVRILARHGFGTVEPGQLLAARGDGVGGVLLGGVLLRGALDAQATSLAVGAARAPATLDAHVAEHDAVAAGLACAGGATLLGHPLAAAPAAALADAFAAGRPAALVSTADGVASAVLTGSELEELHGSLGAPTLDDAAAKYVRRLLRRGATVTETAELEATAVLVDLWVPVPTVVCVGGGAIAVALQAQADVLGWGFARADTLDEALDAVRAFTDADVLVLLDHGLEFDAVLRAGLRRENGWPGRGFLGALGSRHTQSARRERLLAAGVPETDLARVRGPVGLDLGARTPAETAVSIVAEVLVARSGRDPSTLAATGGPIGA